MCGMTRSPGTSPAGLALTLRAIPDGLHEAAAAFAHGGLCWWVFVVVGASFVAGATDDVLGEAIQQRQRTGHDGGGFVNAAEPRLDRFGVCLLYTSDAADE